MSNSVRFGKSVTVCVIDGIALLMTQPLEVKGSSAKLMMNGRAGVRKSDAAQAKGAAMYIAMGFPIPGNLSLKFATLPCTSKLRESGAPFLLNVAMPIEATVTKPGARPNPPAAPQPDSKQKYQAERGGKPVAQPDKLRAV